MIRGLKNLSVPLTVSALLIVVAVTASPTTLHAELTATASHKYGGFVDSSKSSYTNVHANFIVPTITCGGESAFWTGIGSTGSQGAGYLAQTGIDVDCSQPSQDRYYAFYQFWRNYSLGPYAVLDTDNGHPVQPGDSITSVTHNDGSGYFTTTVTDHTRGWSVAHKAFVGTNKAGMAETLVEKPSSCLANFGSVHFTDVTVDGSGMGNTGAAKWNIVNSSGVNLETTGSWDSTHYNFTATWNRTGC